MAGVDDVRCLEERLVDAAVRAAAGHGRHVAAAVAAAAVLAARRMVTPAPATEEMPEDSAEASLRARLKILEAQLRVQDKCIQESGGSLPSLGTAIQGLRLLNSAANQAKHPAGRKLARNRSEPEKEPVKLHNISMKAVVGDGTSGCGSDSFDSDNPDRTHAARAAKEQGQQHAAEVRVLKEELAAAQTHATQAAEEQRQKDAVAITVLKEELAEAQTQVFQQAGAMTYGYEAQVMGSVEVAGAMQPMVMGSVEVAGAMQPMAGAVTYAAAPMEFAQAGAMTYAVPPTAYEAGAHHEEEDESEDNDDTDSEKSEQEDDSDSGSDGIKETPPATMGTHDCHQCGQQACTAREGRYGSGKWRHKWYCHSCWGGRR